ncbi:MAG: DUF4037 domain-containing protein [Clostridia bacterium]|nr:DUF4037 domain-containing protein [Clostridia bacterium]
MTVSKNYFNEYGRPVFAERFPEIYGLLCFGLCGPGSECYGFDDEISRDHDFEPGFCVFYPEDKLTRRQVFELERAYAKLPAEYEGIRRPPVKAYGGVARRGVIGIREYFSRYLGDIGEPGSIEDWLYLSEERLCEALNGEIFVDNYGEITRLRQFLSAPPADVQKKRLAGRLFALSQDGGYNYVRALKRADGAQARLFLDDFTAGAAACIYLLNDMYRPYRKWLIRGLERCVQHTDLIPQLNLLLTSGPEGHTETVEHISRTLAAAALIKYGLELPSAGYGDETGFDMLQSAAFLLNDHISDNELRNTDILYAL